MNSDSGIIDRTRDKCDNYDTRQQIFTLPLQKISTLLEALEPANNRRNYSACQSAHGTYAQFHSGFYEKFVTENTDK